MYNLQKKESRLVGSSVIPTPVWQLHDEPVDTEYVQLERYMDDLYHLFLQKLVQIQYVPVMSPEEKHQLEALLQELLRVKTKLETGLL